MICDNCKKEFKPKVRFCCAKCRLENFRKPKDTKTFPLTKIETKSLQNKSWDDIKKTASFL